VAVTGADAAGVPRPALRPAQGLALAPRSPSPSRRVFVGGVPASMSAADLDAILRTSGFQVAAATEVVRPPDAAAAGLGWALTTLAEPADADATVAILGGHRTATLGPVVRADALVCPTCPRRRRCNSPTQFAQHLSSRGHIDRARGGGGALADPAKTRGAVTATTLASVPWPVAAAEAAPTRSLSSATVSAPPRDSTVASVSVLWEAARSALLGLGGGGGMGGFPVFAPPAAE